MILDAPTFYLVLRVIVALLIEIALIIAGWKIMWIFALHKINFFRQMFGLPKIPKKKRHVLLQEERRREQARCEANKVS